MVGIPQNASAKSTGSQWDVPMSGSHNNAPISVDPIHSYFEADKDKLGTQQCQFLLGGCSMPSNQKIDLTSSQILEGHFRRNSPFKTIYVSPNFLFLKWWPFNKFQKSPSMFPKGWMVISSNRWPSNRGCPQDIFLLDCLKDARHLSLTTLAKQNIQQNAKVVAGRWCCEVGWFSAIFSPSFDGNPMERVSWRTQLEAQSFKLCLYLRFNLQVSKLEKKRHAWFESLLAIESHQQIGNINLPCMDLDVGSKQKESSVLEWESDDYVKFGYETHSHPKWWFRNRDSLQVSAVIRV